MSKKLAGELFDLLCDHPRGLTRTEMASKTEQSANNIGQSLRDLRLMLGDTEDINVACDIPAEGGEWVYRLTGNLDELLPWFENQESHVVSRLTTLKATVSSMPGKKAKLMHTYLTRLVEDLDLLEELVA
jgi:hypothetical protein